MELRSVTGRWYHCPTCWNYSVRPMECCGENMVEEADEEELNPPMIIYETN
jgi:hypothetical protein